MAPSPSSPSSAVSQAIPALDSEASPKRAPSSSPPIPASTTEPVTSPNALATGPIVDISKGTQIPDEEAADGEGADEMPLPLSASIVLTNLPKDASEALKGVGEVGVPEKVTIRFQPVGSAPQLRQKVFKVSSSNRFETVVAFLGRKLAGAVAAPGSVSPSVGAGKSGAADGGQDQASGVKKPTGQVFCYVNNVFAPALDEGIGGLWKCFKTDDQLTVAYSMTPAFG